MNEQIAKLNAALSTLQDLTIKSEYSNMLKLCYAMENIDKVIGELREKETDAEPEVESVYEHVPEEQPEEQ